MDAESAFVIAGNFGRYQFILALILFLGNTIVSQQLLLMVMVGATPNTSIENEKNLTTIVTDFDLFDKSWIVDLIQSLFMVGFLIGCTVFGQLSDSFGRQRFLIISNFFGSIVSFCSGFSVSWEAFAVTRILTGVFLGGSGVILFVLMTELIGKKAWAGAGMVFQIFFSLGLCTIAGLGYWLKKWQLVCFVTGGLGLGVTLLIVILVPESPRWLYSIGKIEISQALLQKISKRNGNDWESIMLDEFVENPKTCTLLDLLRHRKLAIQLCASCFLWFTNGLVYYGLTLSAANLTSDLYVGIVLSGVIEIPANILCIFMINSKWLGRKRSLCLLYCLCVSCSVASVFVQDIYPAQLVIALLNKLAIVGCFNICFVYSSELFPTPLRSVAVGTGSTFARVGAIIAPFIPLLGGNGHKFVPYLIFAILTVISMLVLLSLPETLGKPIICSVEEALSDAPYQQIVNDSHEKVDN